MRTAGYHFWYLAVVGGAAWKIEQALRRFMSRPRQLDSSDAARLLSGLTPARTAPAPHAVHSLDWFHPTAGETPPPAPELHDEGPVAGHRSSASNCSSAAPISCAGTRTC